MTNPRVLVVGAGGQAKIIVDALRWSDSYDVVGYLDDGREAGTTWYGAPVLGAVGEIASVCRDQGIDGGIVSVGDNFQRSLLVRQIELDLPGFRWISAIHPSVRVAGGTQLGHGVLAMAGAVINPDCVIGDHCSIDTRASLDHDSVLEDYVSLAPNVATGGGCHIGAFSAVSIGSSIAHGRRIGAHTVIGAGSVVVRDLPDHVIAYGSPARTVRPRREGEPYL